MKILGWILVFVLLSVLFHVPSMMIVGVAFEYFPLEEWEKSAGLVITALAMLMSLFSVFMFRSGKSAT